ncbi:MAG TPA: hypothetical protein VMG08_12640 [Allosphingosinicella sp.]|nr:hypothetical protein [Allosphingosinicella sp.]
MFDRDTEEVENVRESSQAAVDIAVTQTYMASIPITGIRRRIRARVGCARFLGVTKR